MKQLIQILETAQSKHGGTYPVTLNHLLNIFKLAEKIIEKEQAEGVKLHKQVVEDINPLGQD